RHVRGGLRPAHRAMSRRNGRDAPREPDEGRAGASNRISRADALSGGGDAMTARLLRGGETPGERGLLARGGVAVDDAFGDGLVERTDRVGHRVARVGGGGGERGPGGLHGGAHLRADRAVANAATLVLPHALESR